MIKKQPVWFDMLSIRARLGLAIGLAFIPVLVSIGYGIQADKQQALAAASQNIALLADAAALRQGDVISKARTTLEVLATADQFIKPDRTCDQFLALTAQRYDFIETLRLSATDGSAVCDSRPNGREINIADRPFFISSLETGRGSISDLSTPPFTNVPMIFMGQPIMAGGIVRHVLSAGIPTESIVGRMLRDIHDDAFVLLLDGRGQVAGAWPKLRDDLGRTFTSFHVARENALAKGGAVNVTDIEGRPGLYAFRLVPGAPYIVGVGRPTYAVLAAVEEVVAWRIVRAAALSVLAIGIVMVLLGRWLVSPLEAFRLVAHRLAQGDRFVRFAGPYSGEMGRLASDLDIMAGALADREKKLFDTEARFRSLFNSSGDAIMSVQRTGDGFTVEIANPAAARLFGCNVRDIIGKPFGDLPDAATINRLQPLLEQALETGVPVEASNSFARDWDATITPVPASPEEPERLLITARNLGYARRTEQALRVAHSLLNVALQHMDQGLMLVDAGGTVQLTNDRVARLIGVEQAFLASKPHIEDLIALQYATGDTLPAGMKQPWTEQIRDPDLSWYQRTRQDGTVLEVMTVPLAAGGAVRTYSDITHRIEVQRRLAASEERYRLLAETTSDIIYMKSDPLGPRDYVSPACERVLGFTPGEFAVLSSEDIVHPDDFAASARLMLSLAPDQPPSHHVFRVRHKEGHYVWIESHARLVNFNGKDCIIGSMRDITERKKSEQELAEREEHFRLLAENSSDVITRTSLAGRHLYVSPSCLDVMGYEPDELIGVSYDRSVVEDDRDAFHSQTRRMFAGEVDRQVLLHRRRRKDDQIIWVEISARLVRNGNGEPVEVVNSVRDVSRRQEAERQLVEARRVAEAASQAKTEFLAAMSHEIRTPLNGILGFTDLLLDDPTLQRDHRRKMERIQSAGSALLTVVNDILDFSKVEAGQIEIVAAPMSLHALVGNTLSIVGGGAEAKGLAIVTGIEPGLIDLRKGDEARLRQVLLNLVNNAIKFTRSGTVAVRVTSEPELGPHALRFTVEDTGIGIPADKMDRLFKRFSQADSTVSREFGGTGLGLAISTTLVALMGGKIGVHSVEGVGSIFWFTLPLEPIEEQLIVAPSPATGLRTAKILLVDDLDMNLDVASAVLQSMGYEVDTRTDGASAVRAVETGSYDLVLMDIQMPQMDGITAARLIRSLPGETSQVPIIAMTANVLPHNIEHYRANGMDDHVSKPFRKKDLVVAIERCLAIGTAPTPTILSGAEPTIFDQLVFDELVTVLGEVKTVHMIRDLIVELDGAFTPDYFLTDVATKAATAHRFASPSGMLGFMAVSRACVALEAACGGDGDVDACVEALKNALAASQPVMREAARDAVAA